MTEDLVLLRTAELSGTLERRLQALMDAAFDGDFAEEDWEHALGGWHSIAMLDGEPIAHASVVAREIDVGDRTWRTGYVEAVATAPEAQGRGHGTRVMDLIGSVIRERFEFGGLATGEHHFYERLGWERWRGPTYVIDGEDRRRTTADDDAIMVLRFGPSAEVALTDPITCRARSGDDW